jgi:hypothetical protein
MIKIRICTDTEQECQEALTWFKKKFPNMTFSSPRQGTNPKYIHNPKFFSYGQPRVKNRLPVKINFKNRK